MARWRLRVRVNAAKTYIREIYGKLTAEEKGDVALPKPISPPFASYLDVSSLTI
jgi:hypothetical protein